jgi:hypothetical protein
MQGTATSTRTTTPDEGVSPVRRGPIVSMLLVSPEMSSGAVLLAPFQELPTFLGAQFAADISQ